MKINILLYTYNRSFHTEQVLKGLKKNTILPDKMIVFQDGLKRGELADEWNKVNILINDIDWCKKEVVVSDRNKGLADSIVSGINYAFADCDAVIVLEDDCVPAPEFVKFMQQCFEKYQDYSEIYSVSGYSWPMNLTQNNYDLYGCGRASSWGWGTWKNRWKFYKKDYELLKKIKSEKKSSENLAIWGNDLEDIIVQNVKGYADSWAVFWALNIIARNGICINPYKSLIQNIGTDGTGTHCGTTERFHVELASDTREEFRMPDDVVILDKTKKAFVPWFGSYTAVNSGEKTREKIVVYGMGNFYFRNEKAVNERYNVLAFIDKQKKGWYAGRKIFSANEDLDFEYDKILIMIQSERECTKIAKNLVDHGVVSEKISLGYDILESKSLDVEIDTINKYI